MSVGLMALIIGDLTVLLTKRRVEMAQQQVINQQITLDKFKEMDIDESGEVDLMEFVEFMLISLGKVDRELLEQIKSRFKKLDVDKSGNLTKEDLILLAQKRMDRLSSQISSPRSDLSSPNRTHDFFFKNDSQRFIRFSI